MANLDKFIGLTRVVRVQCLPTCDNDCPKHIPPGTLGTIQPYNAERMLWWNGTDTVRQYAWRVKWETEPLFEWWMMEHTMESEETLTPGFPDAVWTE